MLFSQAQLGLISPWQWSPTTFVFSLVLLTVLYFFSNRYKYGLHHIPGPFLASASDLYRVVHVWRGSFHEHQIALHARYGPVVRLGPNVVSIGNPDAIKLIYGNTSKAGVLNKSEFYPVQQQIAAGSRLETLFTTTNEAFHRKLRRAVSNAYAMSSLLAFEPGVDSTVAVLLEELERRFVGEKAESVICDLGTWLHYFSFDVLMELTFSKRLGFLQGAKDVEGIMGNLERDLAYFAVAGQMPWWDRWIVKNPLKLWLSKKGWGNTTTPVTRFARARVEERSNGGKIMNTTDGDESVDAPHPSRDILSRFQEAGAKDPEFMTPQRVLAVTVANIFAGSDTTAITLRAIFYNLLRHPDTLQKLRKELEAPDNNVFNDQGLASWNKVRELPYLSAVIKEALRCHPAVGLSLERVVPSPGLDICGEFFPAGTIVGCNGWVVHLSERVFGAQPELFRPERWIEASEAQRNEMNNCLFSFGAGSRSCIGKNISFLEMYKVVPALLHRFEINLEDPQKEWQMHNIFFVEQTGLFVKLKSRQ